MNDFASKERSDDVAARTAFRMDEHATWDRLEHARVQALDALGLLHTLNPGEGALYGPKLEFVLRRAGIRNVADVSNEKVAHKIREHTLRRVPYLLVVGRTDRRNGALAGG